jgi:poly(3-hydroxybutyrate) depolymerase
MFSFTLGCEMSDVFRAVAPMAGAQFGGARGCLTQPVAAWIAHGTADETVSYSSGESARDRILELNHCGSTTQSVDPSPCIAYDGCDEGYPVHWCGYDGGHRPPSFIGEGASAFFMQF